MNPKIELEIHKNKKGTFFIEENGERVAQMKIAISGKKLFALHTEVSEKFRGQGIAGKLVDALMHYARENQYIIMAKCSYVASVLKRNPEDVKDITDSSSFN